MKKIKQNNNKKQKAEHSLCFFIFFGVENIKFYAKIKKQGNMFMKKLDLSQTELIKIVKENQLIGKGSYGLIFKLNEETLFKFKYKDFIDDFKVKNNSIQIRELQDISKTLNRIKETNKNMQKFGFANQDEEIKKLINAQNNIKRTILTQGIVFVDDVCVGYLLCNHKNMVNLFDYLEKNKASEEDRNQIFKNIKNAVEELNKNNIFMRDLTTKNVMLNPKTKDIQIIDFEDVCTSVREDRPEYLVKEMADELKKIKEYMFSKNNKNEFLI